MNRISGLHMCGFSLLVAVATASCGSYGVHTDVSPTGHPLVAQYSVSSGRQADVHVEFGLDTNYGRQTWSQHTSPDGSINLLVAGMRASMTYHMRAVLQFSDGTQFADIDHVFTTGAIPPERLPHIMVTQSGGQREGIEFATLFFGSSFGGTPNQLNAVALDEEGNVIWYYDGGVFPMKLLANGHILLNSVTSASDPDGGLREVDLAGNTIREITAPALNQQLAAAGLLNSTSISPKVGTHHDLAALPNGHVIALVHENRTFTDLPGFPGDTLVQGDALVDLDPNGNAVWTWSTFDHLDVNRHPLSFPDWTHANAIVYSPDDGNLLLSIRNQSWVVKIDYRNGSGSGDILWRLGSGGDFTLTNGGAADWNYAQHYPVFTSNKTAGNFPLALFDNGNGRPVDALGTVCGSPNAPCFSRGVIFQIDEGAKTVTTLWQDKLPFSACCGDIQTLPNGNVEFDIALSSSGPQASRVQEVTRTDNPQVVWQMDIKGQLAYRALRIPSLYPGVDW